jgi:hypothetical protein
MFLKWLEQPMTDMTIWSWKAQVFGLKIHPFNSQNSTNLGRYSLIQTLIN